MYQLIWNGMYLIGFSDDGSSVWGIAERQAVWMPHERAEKLLVVVKLLDDITAEINGVN